MKNSALQPQGMEFCEQPMSFEENPDESAIQADVLRSLAEDWANLYPDSYQTETVRK